MYLLVDVSGVLFLFDEPPVGLDWDAVEEVNALLGERLDCGTDAFEAWIAAYNGLAGQSMKPDEFFERIYSAVQFNTRLADWLSAQQGCTVVILSDNYVENVQYFERRFPFARIAETRFYSYMFGCRKDSPELFLRVLEELGADPAECLMIDDNPRNLRVAKSVGLHTHLFTDTEALIAFLEPYCGNHVGDAQDPQ